MPFDGSNLALSPHDLLDAALSASGLTAIEPDALEAHKARQVNDHAPGWAFRHSGAIQLAQAALLVAGVVAFAFFCSTDHYGSGLVISLGTFAVAVFPMLVPIRGPALWKERVDDGRLAEVHPVIRDAAQRLQQRLPDTRFVVGELFQERIRLDPYLVADYRGARAILGIWDGETLIAKA